MASSRNTCIRVARRWNPLAVSGPAAAGLGRLSKLRTGSHLQFVHLPRFVLERLQLGTLAQGTPLNVNATASAAQRAATQSKKLCFCSATQTQKRNLGNSGQPAGKKEMAMANPLQAHTRSATLVCWCCGWDPWCQVMGQK